MSRRIDPERLQQAIEHEFACARCGNCCKGEGLVRIGREEADRIAAHLGLTRKRFLRDYATKLDANTWVLHDRLERRPHAATEQWCIFLERGEDGLYGCRIDPVKPDQCGAFPAKWRNADSLRTCVGLRALAARLRREDQNESD